MKDLKDYMLEALMNDREIIPSINDHINEDDSTDEEKSTERGKIKFTIWQSPEKKLSWIENNKDYQKIECKYEEKEDANEGIKICFLLGFKDNSWKLWMGKIGVVTYSDDPYCSFDTQDFSEAMIKCLDKCEEIIQDIKDHPQNWVQFYDDF